MPRLKLMLYLYASTSMDGISLGFMAASSVSVANEIGKGSAKDANFSIVVTVLTSFTIGFLLFLFFLFFRDRLAYIFTSNKDVATAVGDLSHLLSVFILLNSVQPILSGVAIGAGWQELSDLGNLLAASKNCHSKHEVKDYDENANEFSEVQG